MANKTAAPKKANGWSKPIVATLAKPEPKKFVVKFNNEDPEAPLSNLYLSREAMKRAGVEHPENVEEVEVTIRVK